MPKSAKATAIAKKSRPVTITIRGTITQDMALQLIKRDSSKLGPKTAKKTAALLRNEFGFTDEDLLSLSFSVAN